jgi:hypothetical protein
MSATSKGTQKAIIAGGVLLIAATGFTTAVYLPFMSETAKQRRGELEAKGGIDNHVVNLGGGSRGSMWKNMDKEIKEMRKGHTKTDDCNCDDKK